MADEYPAEKAYEAACSYQAAGKHAEAEEWFKKLLGLRPNDPDLNFRLAASIGEQGRLLEALGHIELALAMDRSRAPFWSIRGSLKAELGRFSDARRDYEEAMRLSPDMPSAHWGRAGCAIWEGDWLTGWADYEWGFVKRDRKLRSRGDIWDGRPVESLFVTGEQGIGDMLQLGAFIRIAKQRGAKRIIWEVPDTLVRLASRVKGVDEVVCQIEDGGMVEAEAWCPIMSLAYALELEACPAWERYIDPDPALVASWASRFKDGRKIGLVWRGNPGYGRDATRSIFDESVLAPLGEVRGTIYSFQRDAEDKPLPFPAEQVGDELFDWADTAAALSHMDALVTTSTGIAHLAGAMGVPTCLLMQRSGQWQFGPGEVCQWYPSVRIFTQPDYGDWRSTCEKVREYLNA
jgi:hypothetical protein